MRIERAVLDNASSVAVIAVFPSFRRTFMAFSCVFTG